MCPYIVNMISSLMPKQERNLFTYLSDDGKLSYRRLTEGTIIVVPRNRDTGLSEEDLTTAVTALVKHDKVLDFPRRETTALNDPPLPQQSHCLHTFIPAKGAQPDTNGFYGFMKCRGTFPSERLAQEQSVRLIKDVDSYHCVRMSQVGHSFPLIADDKEASANVDKIEMGADKNTQGQLAVSALKLDLEEHQKQTESEKRAILDRQQDLLKNQLTENTEEKSDPLHDYCMMQARKTQLEHTYLRTKEQLDGMKANILKARAEIAVCDLGRPEFRMQFMDRIMTARKEVGLDEKNQGDDNFVHHLGRNLDIGF